MWTGILREGLQGVEICLLEGETAKGVFPGSSTPGPEPEVDPDREYHNVLEQHM